MAQVLAPIVQPTTSITMLHTPADAYTQNPSSQPHHPSPRSSQMPRTQYFNTPTGGIGYRGTSATPVQTYAFQQTPQLRQENRSTSAPVNPYSQANFHSNPTPSRPGQQPTHPSSSSGSTASSSSSSNRSLPGQRLSKDDSIISSHQRAVSTSSGDALSKRPSLENRPLSAINLSTSVPDLSFSNFDMPSKPSPDRYRRNRVGPATPTTESPPVNRSAAPSGSGMATVAHLYKSSGAGAAPFRPGHVRTSSADDTQLPRSASSEQAKRYRRRSFGGLDGSLLSPSGAPPPSSGPTWVPQAAGQDANMPASVSRNSFYERNASGESISTASSTNRPSSAKRDAAPQNNPRPSSPKVRQENRSPNIPTRGSSSDKKLTTPSPLSKPATDSEQAEQQTRNQGKTATATVEPATGSGSPAFQQLSALSDKDPNKGVKSRLRRAFSFGSAAELRRASAENNLSVERNRLHKEPGEEVDPEDAAIAAKQEAAGIGEGIYSGQGGVFSGSTDNLSISSTASSASIMLRKMGKGMKKGGRSLKGLFRPKSVIGVPAADSAVTQPSLAQVSMVTVEAEREKVNVNANPHDHTGGGTGFPKLERNSIDTSAHERPASAQASGAGVDGWSRKSIIGGERERAEVLAAVKKGILKRTTSDSPSPVVRPSDVPGITHSIDTSGSSAPSTPGDEQPTSGHMNMSSSDYFIGANRIGSASTKSLPTTPHGGPRNISFSPRIQFHDAWSASEYDRRGDVATCNRLTPMLAQQIKEELNTFKMEMEVHELSKPHTHFF